MQYIDNIVFGILLVAAIWFFSRNVRKLLRNIKLGKPHDRNDRSAERWATMARVALGQGKMGVRPIPAILHGFTDIGFLCDFPDQEKCFEDQKVPESGNERLAVQRCKLYPLHGNRFYGGIAYHERSRFASSENGK